jgi:hypothetical protein
MSTILAEPDTGATLDLIARLSGEIAHALGAEYMPFDLHQPDARYDLLDQARALLMQHAWAVPVAVDEILELAQAQGGYSPRTSPEDSSSRLTGPVADVD